MMQELASYWGSDYDWRKCEARLNDLPQFMTGIEELDIHFIHVRSRHQDALPLIVTHGWPGSIIEQLKIIEPLTNPTAHGASAADAFRLVISSLPGYGFSAKPTSTGWDPARIARAWLVLMKRLEYAQAVVPGHEPQGGVRRPRWLRRVMTSCREYGRKVPQFFPGTPGLIDGLTAGRTPSWQSHHHGNPPEAARNWPRKKAGDTAKNSEDYMDRI